MNSLTRRSFLQLCGVTLAAAALPASPALAEMPRALYGRALHAAAISARPDTVAQIVGRLWPDAITALREADGGFYAVPEGWVPVEAVQPMPGWDPISSVAGVATPGWVEVVAPVAPLRAWASGQAPLATRIGFGGVLHTVDRLTNPDGSIWLAVGTQPGGSPLGWTPADRWRAATSPDQATGDRQCELRLDRTGGTIAALEFGQEILRAPAAVPMTARVGCGTLIRRGPTLLESPPGAAWVLDGQNALVYGVHWHNHFGGPGKGPGWEVLPWVARWLYTWLPEDARVRIV